MYRLLKSKLKNFWTGSKSEKKEKSTFFKETRKKMDFVAMDYSYLKASMGLSMAAFLAG